MDINALHTCFLSTLDANENNRRQAELQLREAEKTPGFINGCLDIVLEPQVSPVVKTASAVYLKNKIVRYWRPLEAHPLQVDPAEQPAFRERIIPALTKVSPQVRPQIVAIINAIVSKDFPSRWPELVDITLALFNSNDGPSLAAGATCLLEIGRHYRWTTGEHREGLNKVIDAAFPGVLQIASSLVNDSSQEAGEMLRDIIKTYKMATYHVLPTSLQQTDSLVGWGTLFLQVIKKDLPQEVGQLDEDEREIHPWVKCKKWALGNLYRLFFRYASAKQLNDVGNDYHVFAQMFVNNFVPEILKTYFEQIQLWAEKKLWLASSCMYNILRFFEQAVQIKSSWLMLKPHVITILSHVVFPLLCPTDADLELFEDEPEEYVHKRIDMIDGPTVDLAATDLLLTLVRKKRKFVLNPMLQFVQTVVERQLANQADLGLAREKEGALRMMGSISYIVLGKNSPIAGQMEGFMVRYVFPDFANPHGFLRARACEFLNAYSETKFQDPNNISFAYQSILKCMHDEHLPVQIEAVLALQPLITHDEVRQALSTRIPEVMQHLLTLGNKCDVDAISGVMEEFVEVFAQQISPFAVQLAEQLRDQFLRLLGELIEKQNIDPDNFNSLEDFAAEDKTMAALGILSTLTSLLLALDNANEVVLKLEEVLLPIIENVLKHDMSEFYAEVFGLVENCTFSIKQISPNMWSVFRLMFKSLDGAGWDYLEDMFPCLDNYVRYGAADLASNQELATMMMSIIKRIMTDEDRLGASDRTIAANLTQELLLGLRGQIDAYFLDLLGLVVDRFSKDSKLLKNTVYHISLLEAVLAAFYYNAQAAMQFLEQKGFTAQFFSGWFANMNHFSRVYDKKLAALAIMAIINLDESSIPDSIKSNLPQLSSGLVTVVGALPDAIRARNDLAKSYENEDFYSFGGDDEGDEWDDDEQGEDEGEEDADTATATAASEYLDYLSAEGAKLQSANGLGYYDEDDEEMEEDPFQESALDAINVYAVFRDNFAALSHSNPAKYQVLTSQLGEADQHIVEQTVARANETAQ